MTHILCIGTGSSGNSYILESDKQILIVECGCRFEDICTPFEYKFGCVSGCVVSHKHSDHLDQRTLKEFIRRGTPVYMAEEVLQECPQEGVEPLLRRSRNKVGGFTIQTFPAPHNVPNCGFLIDTPSKERILFLTDTVGVNLRFKNVNCIMVECNHDDDTLLDNLDKHEVSQSHPEYHLGLEQCIEFCKANMSVSTKQIILIHMSHTNINEDFALKSVQEALPLVKVTVAHSGDTFEIENDDF